MYVTITATVFWNLSVAKKVIYAILFQVLLVHRKLMHYFYFLSFCLRSEVELRLTNSANTVACCLEGRRHPRTNLDPSSSTRKVAVASVSDVKTCAQSLQVHKPSNCNSPSPVDPWRHGGNWSRLPSALDTLQWFSVGSDASNSTWLLANCSYITYSTNFIWQFCAFSCC